jgi:Rad3-related DNA helicase
LLALPDSPRDIRLPHDEWRPYQKENLEWILGNEHNTLVLEAPTGTGKTLLAKGVAHFSPVMSCVKTRSLQATNYGRTYGFSVLYGRGSYPCVHPEASRYATCDDCKHGADMHNCPYVGTCEYNVAKQMAQKSGKASLNYAYFLTSRWPRQYLRDSDEKRYLFLDECHQLSDEVVIEYAGTTISQKVQQEWDLPDFPELTSLSRGFSVTQNPIDEAIGWLSSCQSILNKTHQKLESRTLRGDDEARKRLHRCDSLINKISATIQSVASCSDDRIWYIRSGVQPRKRSDEYVSQFEIRPYTARQHFPKLFLGNHKTVLMSATIGDFATFAKELGLTDYDTLRVPSNWPPEVRPVHILDVPKMGRRSTTNDPKAYDKQADSIVKFIKEQPSNWYGLIHTTSKQKAYDIAERLSRRGLGRRIWVTPRESTDEQMAQWEQAKRKIPGAIAVAWTWHEGVDLGDVNICIISGIQFGFLGDEYEEQRMYFDPQMYRQRAAWATEQMAGRIRRGEREHYNLDGVVKKVVAIADGNHSMLDKYYSESFRESLVKYG